jgi:hypothetical protein
MARSTPRLTSGRLPGERDHAHQAYRHYPARPAWISAYLRLRQHAFSDSQDVALPIFGYLGQATECCADIVRKQVAGTV